MVKGLVHDPMFLAQKSEPATEADAPKKDKFNGFTAQIIQHELDHVNGVLI